MLANWIVKKDIRSLLLGFIFVLPILFGRFFIPRDAKENLHWPRSVGYLSPPVNLVKPYERAQDIAIKLGHLTRKNKDKRLIL